MCLAKKSPELHPHYHIYKSYYKIICRIKITVCCGSEPSSSPTLGTKQAHLTSAAVEEILGLSLVSNGSLWALTLSWGQRNPLWVKLDKPWKLGSHVHSFLDSLPTLEDTFFHWGIISPSCEMTKLWNMVTGSARCRLECLWQIWEILLLELKGLSVGRDSEASFAHSKPFVLPTGKDLHWEKANTSSIICEDQNKNTSSSNYLLWLL